MSEKLTDQQISAYKEAFSLFDKDGDGYITSAELGTALRALGHTPSESDVAALIQQVGTETEQGIDFPEFLAIMAKSKKSQDSEADVREAFKVFDQDGSGSISSAELRRLLVSVGDKLSVEDAEAMIKEVDTAGSGQVNLNELAKFLCAK